jgi:small GTP-binding protein
MAIKNSVPAPPSFQLRHTLRGYRNTVYMLSWSPDGQMLASPSGDRLIHIWNAETGEIHNTIRFTSVECANWSPDGQIFISVGNHRQYGSGIQVWDPKDFNFQYLVEIGGIYIGRHRFAWSPDSHLLAVWNHSGNIKILDIRTGELFKTLEVPRKDQHDGLYGGSWSPNGKILALVSQHRIQILHIDSGEVIDEIEGYYDWGSEVDWSPDGDILAFGGSSNPKSKSYNVYLWNLKDKKVDLLEGYTSSIPKVIFSPDARLLFTKSADGIVRFWRCDTWQLIAVFKNLDYGSGVALNPQDSSFAILGEDDRVIRIWDVDTETLLSISSSNNSVRYRNAKVVLIGDQSVGKSALGMVLAEEEFKATVSTHGRHVWSLETKHHKTTDDLWEIRETLLWDLAGQAEYRLVHQLSLDQINVALLLFDGSSPTDPFKGVAFWNKALQQAKGSGHLTKYLVAARTDVSSLNVTDVRMNDFALEHGFHAVFRTSALTGLGIEELRQCIEGAIVWDKLQLTISESLFKQMKDFTIARKRSGNILEKITKLIQYFRTTNPEAEFDDAEFRSALGRVESHDLVKILSFGDYILLQPELLDNYASAMARAAREQPDGLGFLNEQAAREGQLNFGSLDRLSKDEEQIILQSVIEFFIDKELAIIDEGSLIFPSQFNRELPEHPEVQGTVVSYKFEGALLNAYTTLVVRLYHSEAFVKESLWKNAAIFLPFGLKGQTKHCGFAFKEIDEGVGRISIFFGRDVVDETKILFLKYVHEHLKRKTLNGKVVRERIYRCPKCQQEVIDRRAVKVRIERGEHSIPCLYCSISTEILLTDLIEETFGKDDDFLAKVRQMDEQINAQHDNDCKDAILKGEFIVLVAKAGQIFRPIPSDDWGIDGEIEFKNDRREASGRRVYVQLKSGASHLNKKKDGSKTFQIPKKRHIDYWQAHEYPVYLVIRDENERIYWMNITDYLAKRTDKNSRTIIFEGRDVTVEEIVSLREFRLGIK